MNLAGLNSNRYLVNNRIPIFIDESFSFGSEVNISITRNSDNYSLPEITLYPSPSGLSFDLAPYLKDLMPNPYIPGVSYSDPIPNTESFNITFSESQTGTSNMFLNKTFIRGGRRTASDQAQTLSINERLSPVDRIPIWQGFPTAAFWIDSGNKIRSSTVVTSDVKIMRQPKSCNPFYIRFLNSLGGYSFWMFNSWESELKTDRRGIVNNFLQKRSLGFKEENTIKADTRVKREFYPLMQDLLSSPVVEKYEDGEWSQIFIKANSFAVNNYEDLAEITCDFELKLNYNPQVS